MQENLNNEGIVKISEDVISIIAGIAASEIEGVAGMNTTIVGGFTEKISGKKSLSKGVKVTLEEGNPTVELSVVVEYGVKIYEVAQKVQENVKKTIETMTGLKVNAINVYIENIILPKKEEEQE
ncbi:Uncharacterized conserved protein YloU, alkaline shock protein (Asp23) family [Hathewaya proteolytica DSM 3090]|uniref:Uncharacterized conserved protein YloU, alkaline shock protein (Asp23) family n=1 Tax=Hathewaya proteolytica DSM 3090 TaxID=1121331 RepID=A0A1M6L550_9CLOT|nr:Asp23/Gls24 family envelope stress response protein [Hathewaya proteolytica]SHJ66254.1 Uncharacterized conserved protein YloU, alkaline shock protein (Asp23) family [Hathewaya proteolytica DSM 3090]